MRIVLIIISIIGLMLTIVPAFMVFFGSVTLETNKHLMLAGMLCWFVTAPFWMNKEQEEVV